MSRPSLQAGALLSVLGGLAIPLLAVRAAADTVESLSTIDLDTIPPDTALVSNQIQLQGDASTSGNILSGGDIQAGATICGGGGCVGRTGTLTPERNASGPTGSGSVCLWPRRVRLA